MSARHYVLLIVLWCAIDCGGASMRDAATTGVAGEASGAAIEIVASRWAYAPSMIVLRVGQSVELKLTSSDVHHGFNVPGLGLRADVMPGLVTSVRVTPKQRGTFPFHCDYYCGEGHEGMEGQIVVE